MTKHMTVNHNKFFYDINCNLDALGSRSETPGKFWNVLEKDGKDQLDWSCEKWSIT